jgi:hypothetical protein
MNRSGLVRAWPIVVASLLSFCLTLGLARDFAWLLVIMILALLIFGFVRVTREFGRNGNVPTGDDGTGSE